MERESSEEEEEEEVADQRLQTFGKNYQSSFPQGQKMKVKSSIQRMSRLALSNWTFR
jgi:hypothetical protein